MFVGIHLEDYCHLRYYIVNIKVSDVRNTLILGTFFFSHLIFFPLVWFFFLLCEIFLSYLIFFLLLFEKKYPS